MTDVFTPQVAEAAVALSGPCDPSVPRNAPRIYEVLRAEEATFTSTLGRGQKQLEDMLGRLASRGGSVLAGPDAFLLYDSFGFPLELTQEMAAQHGVQVRCLGGACSWGCKNCWPEGMVCRNVRSRNNWPEGIVYKKCLKHWPVGK